MRVKTKSELSSLDEELHLFDESDWNFLEIQSGANLEYFNDIVDDDFRKRGIKDFAKTVIMCLTFSILFLYLGVWFYNSVIARNVLSQDDISSTNDKSINLARVENGSSVSDEDFIEISKLISSYFGIFRTSSSFASLNDFCLTSSTFFNTEETFRNQMSYAWDKNDCYARALRCLINYFEISKINEVIYKDDIYYVYAQLSYPDEASLTEYFYIYGNDMSKFFSVNEITEQNIVRYIIQLADTYGLPTSEKEVCFEVCKSDVGSFVILDDSFITNGCTTTYNYAVSQAVKILGANKATTQYE